MGPTPNHADAAHKTLWGFVKTLAPEPIQELVRQATAEERYATVSGWLHVYGSWYWHKESNTLMEANARFVCAYNILAEAGQYD
jgi:hypothetical protein